MRRTTSVLSTVLMVAAAAAGVLVAISGGALDWVRNRVETAGTTTAREPAGDSLYGDFLVAREAGTSRDVREAARRYLDALERDPDNTMLIQRAFLFSVQAGDMATGVALARRLVGMGQNPMIARLVLVAEAAHRGDFAMARAESDAMLAIDQGISTRLINAWAMVGQGLGTDARRELSKLSGQRGFDVLGEYHAGLVAAILGDREAAKASFVRAIEVSEGRSARILAAYGAFLEEGGDAAGARAVYDRGLGQLPDNILLRVARDRTGTGLAAVWRVKSPSAGMAESLFNIATVFGEEDGLDVPVVYLQLALWLEPELANGRLVLAEMFERGKRFEDANAIYLTISSDDPLYVSAVISHAVNLNRMDRTDDAVALIRDAVASGEKSPQLMTALGDLERDRKNWAEAADAYSVAIAAIETPAERHWLLYFARGIAYERAKRWTEAESDLRMALSLKPDQPTVLNYLGYSFVDRGENLDEAMEMIRRAVDLTPNDGFITDSLAWAYYRRGDYATAVIHLERAVELAPFDPTINDHLGDVYWKVGREREARFQWQRALSLSPEEADIPAIRKKLEHGLAEAPRADVSGIDPAPEAPAPAPVNP